MKTITTQAELEALLEKGELESHILQSDAAQALMKEQVDTQVAAILGDTVGEQMDIRMAKFSRELKRDGLTRLPQAGSGHNADAPGAALDADWDRMGDFLKAISPWAMKKGLDDRLAKALNEGSGDQGGFLVPEEFRAQLLSLSLESAIVRPRAFVIPMGAERIKIPTIRDTSHATNVHGGVQAYWVPESGTYTESEPTFSQLALTAKKLTGLTSLTNELVADAAISAEAIINRVFGDAITFFEEEAYLNGDGVAEPLGIINADALISVAKESGQAADTVVVENIDKMWSRLLPSSQANAVWIANPDVYPQLAGMSRNVGTGGSAVWMSNMVGGPPAAINGRPLFFSEKARTVGDLGDLYLLDLSYYVIGDRQSMTMSASEHDRFRQDETVFKFTERLDARPWLETELTPRYGTNTLSPFVALAARA